MKHSIAQLVQQRAFPIGMSLVREARDERDLLGASLLGGKW
jgi:hypothetical protein